MSRFQQRHYESMAYVIRESKRIIQESQRIIHNKTGPAMVGVTTVQDQMIKVFEQDSAKFDVEKFRKACECVY